MDEYITNENIFFLLYMKNISLRSAFLFHLTKYCAGSKQMNSYLLKRQEVLFIPERILQISSKDSISINISVISKDTLYLDC